MKNIILICFLFIVGQVQAQTINCNAICVTDISIDSITGEMLVTIYNGDSVHVNYPTVQVINSNGDTIGNQDGFFFFFAHMPGDTVVHSIPTTVSSLPPGFTGIVLFTDQIWNVTCTFSYPMNCFLGQPWPDCNDLTVEGISIDSVAGLMDVTIFNSCANCASGMNGPVYCEMKVIRNVAPFDTLAEANCFCFLTPDNNDFQTYTLTSYVTSLPPISELTVVFHCGGGTCDTLQNNPVLDIADISSKNYFIIYPNPSKGFVTIESKKELGEVILIDLKGKLLGSYSTKENEVRLDISHLVSGIYLIRVDGVNNKLVKQ